MRWWHRNLREIGWSLGATRNEGLGPNSICSAPNLRRAPTRPEAPTTLEARKRFSDQRRPPDRVGMAEPHAQQMAAGAGAASPCSVRRIVKRSSLKEDPWRGVWFQFAEDS